MKLNLIRKEEKQQLERLREAHDFAGYNQLMSVSWIMAVCKLNIIDAIKARRRVLNELLN